MPSDKLIQCRVCGLIHCDGWESDHEAEPLTCDKCGRDILLLVDNYDPNTPHYCEECTHTHEYHTEVYTRTVCKHCGCELCSV